MLNVIPMLLNIGHYIKWLGICGCWKGVLCPIIDVSTDLCMEDANATIDVLMAFKDSAKMEFDSWKDLDNSHLNSFSSFPSCVKSLSLCAAESCLSIFFRLSSMNFGTSLRQFVCLRFET